MNKENFKVQCTITINGHEKICYPFEGTFMQCRLYIYSEACNMFITQRRARNLQQFFGLSIDDETGMIYFSIKRLKNYREKIKLNYRIIQNNKTTKQHD